MLRALVLLLCALAASALRGVCYDSYNSDSADWHFTQISTRFDLVRTYQTWTPKYNLIDLAANKNLLIYAGIWIRGNGVDFNQDLNAAIDGVRRHPNAVKAVLVGNEDLMNGWNADGIISKVNAAKNAFKAAGLNVPIGSVQTDAGWLNNPNLANACDILGVNIYPFFGSTSDSYNNPVADLDRRWNAMTAKYGSKVVITETGWPDSGGNYGAHIASTSNAQSYFFNAQKWMDGNKGGEIPSYFMFHDNRGKPNYEGHFALAEPSGAWKFDFNVKSGNGNANNGNANNGNANSDKPQGTFQLVTPRGKAMREWYGGLAAKDNNRDAYTMWTYDATTQLLKNQGSQTCLDAYTDNGKVKVHFYSCDGNNKNQKWRLVNSKVVHATYNNICLDADPTDSSERVQVWSCVDNNSNQVFTITSSSSAQRGVLRSQNFNLVLATGNGDQISFKAPNNADTNTIWTFDQKKLRSENKGQCLDAWEARNGATVHIWPCDASNTNQNWQYDANTKQLRHAALNGYCLDMSSDSGSNPHLWQCHSTSDYWIKYQQFSFQTV